jgi:glycosyltransferase involved in cell wall biosynthesis
MSINIETIRCSPAKKAIFSIIIPSWNNLPYLQFCIDSIRKNSLLPHQIIVHVNEGKDGTLEWIKNQPDIDYTHSTDNIGICYALNYCRQLMTTDYLLYINDDMYVCPGWDKTLYEEIEAVGHKYFFLSSTQFEPVTENPCCISANYGSTLETFREADFVKEFNTYQKSDWQGATWPPNVVHKDIWDLAGGYSIEFSPGMSSDPDFSMKLWKMGIRLFKGVSKSRVYHFGSKSTRRIIKNDGYYMFINKWGMSTRIFQRNYLRLGALYEGMAKEAETSFLLKARNLYKRINSAFHKKV